MIDIEQLKRDWGESQLTPQERRLKNLEEQLDAQLERIKREQGNQKLEQK